MIFAGLPASSHAEDYARLKVRGPAPGFVLHDPGRKPWDFNTPGAHLLTAAFPHGGASGEVPPNDRLKGGERRRGSGSGRRDEAGPTAMSAGTLPSRFGLINEAYIDAYSVVMEDSACSQFFGGPVAALRVLTELAKQLRLTKLGPGVGIRMHGPTTIYRISDGRLTFRLFDRAEVNSDGPFGQQQPSPFDMHTSNVGNFAPYTREARVLMILHEIGHLIEGPDGAWLLPNDGGDGAASDRNTSLVESKCGAQIRRLNKRRL